MQFQDIVLKSKKIEGNCPLDYKKGETIYIKGGLTVDREKSDRVCLWVLSEIMPVLWEVALGTKPKELGIAKFACAGCKSKETEGGSVTFDCELIE
jgi:uncharacterized repeat protein (TIGR04076 family)